MTDSPTLSSNSRVWIYQSNRPFQSDDLPQLRQKVDKFAQTWAYHGTKLTAHGDVYHNRFIVLMVDEEKAGVGGCSLDRCSRFLREIEKNYGVELFDRMTFAWLEGDAIRTADSEEFARLYREGKINDNTLVFDNMVNTKAELEEKWLKPLGDSWHKRFV